MTAIFTESEYEIELSSVQGPAGTDGLGVTDIVAGDGIIIDAIQASQINIEIDETFVEENAQEMGLLSATQVQTFTDEEKEQLRSNAGIVTGEPAICFIAVGESNSGGYAPNASAFVWELASRPELQMLNTSTLTFQNLDIGTNNNLNHLGLNSTTHGWELELANACKREEFDRDVYYIQTGQGGSLISEWAGGGYFNTSFLPRVNAAKAIFGIRPVQYVVWLSIGINDAIAATDSYLFKGRLRTLIKDIKDQLPGVKICLGRIMRTNASYEAIDDRITEFADDPAIRIVSINSLTTDGGNHWDYQGMRGFSERMLDATRQMVSIPARPLSFTSSTATIDGSLISFSAINQYANAVETIDFSYDQSIEVDWRNSMAGLVFALDTDITELAWAGGSDPFLLGFYENAGLFYITETNGAVTGTAFSTSGISRLRLRKSGNNLLLESTTDMATWTLRHTRSGVLSGVGSVRLKMKTAIGAASVRAYSVSSKQLEPLFTVEPHNQSADTITSGRLTKDRQHLQTAYLDASSQSFVGAASFVNQVTLTSTANAILQLSTVYGAGATIVQFFASGSDAQNTQLSCGVGSASNFVFYTGGASLTERVRIDNDGLKINDGGTMKQIQIGAADSGGTGFKMLRIAN